MRQTKRQSQRDSTSPPQRCITWHKNWELQANVGGEGPGGLKQKQKSPMTGGGRTGAEEYNNKRTVDTETSDGGTELQDASDAGTHFKEAGNMGTRPMEAGDEETGDMEASKEGTGDVQAGR